MTNSEMLGQNTAGDKKKGSKVPENIAAVTKNIKKLVNDTKTDGRTSGDTIKLWEGYREQATLWRAVALLQMPGTAFAVALCIMLWSTHNVTLKVPERPLPGTYLAQDIPDVEFINEASDFVNLIASYQPAVARRQFEAARQKLVEPFLTKFDTDIMNFELKAIESTSRTQILFVDPTQSSVRRVGKEVLVTFIGDRLKMVAGKELPTVKTKFTVALTTVPRNSLNKYGIVVSNLQLDDLG